jgi:hypothetical protein
MRSFCIVVQRGHEDLYEALRQAFGARPGFNVLVDRRGRRPGAKRSRRSADRRASRDDWGGAHSLITESLEPSGG